MTLAGAITRPFSPLGRWIMRRLWWVEHAFERSRASDKAVDDTRLRIFFVLALFAAGFVTLALGAGKAALFRYADDAVFLFANETDARRVLEVLPKRLGKYGLELHPDKTRLVDFRRPDRLPRGGGNGGSRTFDLLGFTHFWGKARSGKWVVKRRTAKDRFRRAITRVALWCRKHRHDDVRAQQKALAQKLRGHFGYYGIIGNYDALGRFLYEVKATWRKWLNRRSQRSAMSWERMHGLLERYPLPTPRVARPLLPRAARP